MATKGLGLIDIGPNSEMVPIRKNEDGSLVSVEVLGVSAKGIVEVFKRYPEMMEWFKGGKVDLTTLISQAPDAMAAVIAAGCGDAGNEQAEEIASNLPMEAQLAILEAIGRQTFALNGFGPFVQKIIALAAQAKSNNYGRAQVTKSPATLKPSLPPDTAPPKSGT